MSKKKSSLRIAMIGHKRIPSREGGVEIVVEELASRMAEAGCEVTVYNRGGHHVAGKENDNSKTRQTEYKGIRLITVPTSSRRSLNAICYALGATLHALFGHYDVIHYHAEGSCAVLWIPHLFGIRTIATIHGLDWQRSKWGGFATKFLLLGEKTAVRYADEIIVLSKNVQQYFLDTYQRRTVLIPNGICIPEARPADLIREKYGLQPERYLLFLARIVPEKGLHYLIEAYQQSDTDMPLVIAGGSSHTDAYLEQIQEMTAGDPAIIMTGFVEGQLLEELYSNCYIYLLPSDIEGMPISLLEALSYGRACLCSDIKENRETAGECASYFAKGDVQDLTRQLNAMLQSENQNKESDCKKRKEYVSTRYDWNRIVQQTMHLYREFF